MVMPHIVPDCWNWTLVSSLQDWPDSCSFPVQDMSKLSAWLFSFMGSLCVHVQDSTLSSKLHCIVTESPSSTTLSSVVSGLLDGREHDWSNIFFKGGSQDFIPEKQLMSYLRTDSIEFSLTSLELHDCVANLFTRRLVGDAPKATPKRSAATATALQTRIFALFWITMLVVNIPTFNLKQELSC